jgi:LuxR family maltose regulon positive regulatory protein
VRADPRLAVSLAWAAGLSGRFTAMGPWLDAAEPRIDQHSPPLEGWSTLRGAATAVRAYELGVVQADLPAALTRAAAATELEPDPDRIGYVVARTVLAAMLVFADRCAEAIPVAEDAWASARSQGLSPLLGLQAASILSSALSETGHVLPLRRLFAEVNPVIDGASRRWGATVSGLARLRTVEGRLAHSDGDLAAARALLRGAVELARTFSLVPTLVTALTALAEVELDHGDRAAAHAALGEAREAVDDEAVMPLVVRALRTVERRAGGSPVAGAVPPARRPAAVVEELTDRERAVLRGLTGTGTLREIGASLYLSINTVKGYTKVLYRKLGVATRQDAVRQARALGLL